MEELQFTEFTGADAATAKAFLAASGGSVEAAVGAFFQTGGTLPATTAAAGDAPQPPPRPTSVTMASTSQFTHGMQGKSACTTMAICACARLIDRAAAAALTAADVDAIVADGVASYIANPLSAAGTAPHMSFGEAFAGGSAPGVGAAAPARPFSEALRVHSEVGGITSDAFDFLATTAAPLAASLSAPVGIVVTKPPESVAVIVDPSGSAMVIDSHPRPHLDHLNAAHALSFASVREAQRWLLALFPPMDLSDCDPAQAFMYNAYDAVLLAKH